MQLSQKEIGCLFMCGLPGPVIDEGTLQLIHKYHISNFILFRRNIQSPEQLQHLCADLRHHCRNNNMPPPLIAIDQEGGSASRLPPPFRQFDDARKISTQSNADAAAISFAKTCAQELHAVGINMNLAPVLDVCPEEEGYIMERRCLSHDYQEVADLGSIIISEMQNQGVAACAKHFPGLGSATLDPHKELPLITKNAAAILVEDILPFTAAIKAKVAAIMTSHTTYQHLDQANQATLSTQILTDLLRKKLSYDGLIITDDLEMGAIVNCMPIPQAALKSFQAGADLLLICEEQQHIKDSCSFFTDALASGIISQQRCQASLTRIMSTKESFTITGREANITKNGKFKKDILAA